MGSPETRPVIEWRKLHPGCKALILMPTGNAKGPIQSFILKSGEEAPEGKYKLLAVID